MGFNKLIEILNFNRKTHPALAKRLDEAEALGRWEKAVGPAIAKHSRAIRVQEEVLWVEVDHPLWKSELHHRKRQILEILNNNAPAKEAILKDLLFLDPRPAPRRS